MFCGACGNEKSDSREAYRVKKPTKIKQLF